MPVVVNSTQTAIKLRCSVEYLFSVLNSLQSYAKQTRNLRGCGANLLSNNMVNMIT